MEETSAELLARLRPALEEIFVTYGISEGQARQILEETLLLLISKRWDRQDPGRWLLRTVVERCRETSLGGGEEGKGRG
jgi:DNA-directed RNA polymerase specialized sigma24 family protein